MDFPKSPTGTTGMQKAFAIAVRKVFRDRLKDVYKYLQQNKPTIKESLVLKSALDDRSVGVINNMLEGIKMDLSPIVKTYVLASWWKGNRDVATTLKLGAWVPFNKRVLDAFQNDAYSYVYKFVDGKQDELKEILTEGISQGDTISSIAGEIKDSFKVTAWKSELIARSEVIKTYGQSTRMAIKNGGVTKEYQWKTSLKENVCSVCRPLHNRVFLVDNPNSPMPVVDTHPQCNCGIIPHVRF